MDVVLYLQRAICEPCSIYVRGDRVTITWWTEYNRTRKITRSIPSTRTPKHLDQLASDVMRAMGY